MKEELPVSDGDNGRSDELTSMNLSTEVATCLMNLARVIGFRAYVSSLVGICLFQYPQPGHYEGAKIGGYG